MSTPVDPELDDVLQDSELLHLAHLLSSVRAPEPKLDDAFRSGLRRQLMLRAWAMTEGKVPWWRRIASPPGLAWAGAAAGVVILAAVVVFMSTQQPGGFNEIVITSPIQDGKAVSLQQPILVSFNQPMDHPSTEGAVQIQPATQVAYSWQANTLAVQPLTGDLAPNTQYQVTIGPGARTAAGQQLAAPQTITFVTQPTTTPPPPTPTAKPSSLLTAQQPLTPLGQGIAYPPQWSADSVTLYVVAAGGALVAVPVKAGDVKILVPSGVSLPSIAPAGDRIAYVRGGKIEILTLASSATTALSVAPAPTSLGWVRDKLYWGANDGVYRQAADGLVKVASIPGPNEATALISIAPDGAHAVYQSANSLFVLDTAAGKSFQLGSVGSGTTFQGWSPDGSRLIYNSVIADMQGHTVSTLPSGDPSWSAQNEVLLGSDTELVEVRPDGTGLRKLADGSFNRPVWAPDSATFSFERGGTLWGAKAPATAALPGPLDQASALVTAFMQARLAGTEDKAKAFLDDSGRAAYSDGGPSLVPTGDAHFSRFYILTSELSDTGPNSVRVVVRLVFTHGKVDDAQMQETLVLQRSVITDPLLIHSAAASSRRHLGKGPEVVAVDVSATQVAVTFDSDLVASTVTTGVVVRDAKDQPVDGTTTYAHRTVTITGLHLDAGAPYTLVVLTKLQDVDGRHMESEYDLEVVGPGTLGPTVGHPIATPSPSPTPPASTPSPSAPPATPTPK